MGWVISVAYSPDGTKIISSGSQDKTLCIQDALGGLLENTLKGHTDGVTSVAYSPDGTKIISGLRDKPYAKLVGHPEGVYTVAFFLWDENVWFIR